MRSLIPCLWIVGCASCGRPDAVSLPTAASGPPALRWEILNPPGYTLASGAVELTDGHLVSGGWAQPAPAAELVVEAVIGPQGELSWAPWTTGFSAQRQVALGEGDADGDGDPDVLTAIGDEASMTFRAFDESTRALVVTHTLPVPSSTTYGRVYLVESDGDALPEVLITSYWDAFVLDDDGMLLARTTWGQGPANAGFDYGGDGLMDAVGPDGTIYRGSDLQPVAAVSVGYVTMVADIDADGDGDHDLLTGDGFTWTLFDGITFLPRWTLPQPRGLTSPFVLDVDGDGIRELVFASGAVVGVALSIHDPLTGALRRTVPSYLQTGTQVVPWDHDHDGTVELLVGFSSGGGLYDPGRGWGRVKPFLDSGTFVATGDPDGDGVTDVLLRFFGARALRTRVDGLTGVVAGSVPHAPWIQHEQHRGFGDLDGDGDDELIVSGYDTHEVSGLPGGPVVAPGGGPFVVGAFHPAGPRTLVQQSRGMLTATRAGAPLWTHGGDGKLAVGDLSGSGIDALFQLTPSTVQAMEGATGVTAVLLRGAWTDMEVAGIPGGMRMVLVRDAPGCEVDVFAWTPVGMQLQRTSVFSECAAGIRAFGDHLFVPGEQLTIEELTTGARDVLDLRTWWPETIQPIDGGFVVLTDRVGVQAFDL